MVTLSLLSEKWVASAPSCKLDDAGGERVRVMLARDDVRFAGDASALALSPSGRYLAAHMSGGVSIWQAEDLLPLWRIAVDPDWLTWRDDDTVDALSAATGDTTHIAVADGTMRTEHVLRVPVHGRDGATSVVVREHGLELRDRTDRLLRTLSWPAGGTSCSGWSALAMARR